MAVTLPETVLARYERFSLYNSPYPAHDGGCAIDLYPGTLTDGRTTAAPSPVAGTVRATRTVRAPPKPYAPEHDHLILLEPADSGPLSGLTVRILHVEPSVEAGDQVEPGDSLGRLVRAGFFAPWVDNHLHVGFRGPDQNPIERLDRSRSNSGCRSAPRVGRHRPSRLERRHVRGPRRARTPRPGNRVRRRASRRRRRSRRRTATLRRRRTARADRFARGERSRSRRLAERRPTRRGRRPARSRGDVTVTANGETITGLSVFCARDGTSVQS